MGFILYDGRADMNLLISQVLNFGLELRGHQLVTFEVRFQKCNEH